MTQYRILIQKIDKVTKTTTDYVRLWDTDALPEARKIDPKAKQYDYLPKEVTEEVAVEIYKQTVEFKPEIMKVIEAFNRIDPKEVL